MKTEATNLGFKSLIFYFSSLLLLLNSCSTANISPTQLNKKGFYQEAELALKSKKGLSSSDNEELLISLYNQRKYKEAGTLMNSLNQVELMKNEQTKLIVPSLKRISGNYETSDLTASLSQTEINQLYKWPSTHKEIGTTVLTKTNLLEGDEQFTGAGYDPSKETIYLAKISGKEEMKTPYYSIKNATLKNNMVTDGWKNTATEADKNRIYTTSPSIASNKTMYFSMNLFDGAIINPSKMVTWNKDSLVNYLGIFSSKLDNSEKAVPLPETINQLGSNNTHPHLLNDTILFFSSDRAKKGNMDIYYSILKFGNWSTPEALSLNSSADDIMPVSDGKNIYFSSRGHENFGGFDVFKCKLNFANGKVTSGKVENMMLPFNSSSDDIIALLLDESHGYLATNRNKDNGDEIYHFTLEDGNIFSSKLTNLSNDALEGTLVIYYKDKNNLWVEESRMNTNGIGVIENINLKKDRDYKLVYSSPENEDTTIYILMENETNAKERENQIKGLSTIVLPWSKSKGTVKDRISNQGIEGVDIQIEFTDLNGEQVTQKFKTDNAGEWIFDILPGKDYKLSASKKGYERISNKPVTLQELRKVELIALSQESKKGDKINIPNVYFDFNSAALQKESFIILDNIVSFLNEKPSITVELSAHTDSKGSDSYNQTLSQKRAKTCYDYLVSKNIDPKRLTYKGYGETQLKNRCVNGVECSDEENAINRRMELKVVKE